MRVAGRFAMLVAAAVAAAVAAPAEAAPVWAPAPAQVVATAAVQIEEAPAATAVARLAVASAAQASVPQGSGLPQRPPPPRTLSAQWPVFVLFTVVWLAIVGYVLTFNGRLRRVAARLGGDGRQGGAK